MKGDIEDDDVEDEEMKANFEYDGDVDEEMKGVMEDDGDVDEEMKGDIEDDASTLYLDHRYIDGFGDEDIQFFFGDIEDELLLDDDEDAKDDLDDTYSVERVGELSAGDELLLDDDEKDGERFENVFDRLFKLSDEELDHVSLEIDLALLDAEGRRALFMLLRSINYFESEATKKEYEED